MKLELSLFGGGLMVIILANTTPAKDFCEVILVIILDNKNNSQDLVRKI